MSIFSRLQVRHLTWGTILLITLGTTLNWGYRALTSQAMNELENESRNRLTLFVSNLKGTLANYEHLPELISTSPYVLNVLTQGIQPQIEVTNRYLESVVNTQGASDVYLMDSKGFTVAASNWNLERSFVGQNFNFRPYFQTAIKGGAGRYFALGTTSLQRGYYFSYPVYQENKIEGVIVIKINLADIEAAWSERGNHFLVTDDDGIIFLTTHKRWIYKSIYEIDADRVREIKLSRRYAEKTIRRLLYEEIETLNQGVTLVAIKQESESIANTYLHLQQKMLKAGWTVHLLSDTNTIRGTVVLRATLGGFAALIVLLLVTLYIVNRQRRLALQGSTELLELRVQQRTGELETEIDERKKAEQNLRDTQAELIQAAKLAGLGQMSAGISHELNQPLTAIRSYSKNAQRMLERNQIEDANQNLGEIVDLTQHMASIISQLRGFSRKSGGDRTRVSVERAVDQALGMFRREIKKNKISVHIEINPELSVVTDHLLLNQVLVNLISNAIHAMASVDIRQITIDAESRPDGLTIGIGDSGPGIPANVIENVFDPFFTTKEVGLGLGLGLSISYRIMESLGGKIEVANCADGGARFELYLPDDE